MSSPAPSFLARLRGAAPTLVLALLAGCATAPPASTPPTEPPETAAPETAPAQPTPPAPEAPAAAEGKARGTRTAVILAVNDVYRIEGVENGAAGGLARLRTLREELEREHPDLLLLHGGDLLFPSFLSRTYNGEQMIDVLNLLDGDPAAFDERMFAVFGNHEFEKDKAADAGLLDGRVEASQFRWLGGNLTFAPGPGGAPAVAAPNLGRSFLVESGGIRIGVFGLTTDVKRPAYVAAIAHPVETAHELTADLRARGAEVVVALTHLGWETDANILETLGPDGPDLIIGGHDHGRMAYDAAGRLVLKADADARTATVARLTLTRSGTLAVAQEHRPLAGGSAAPDPEVQARVDSWLERHAKLFCGKEGAPPDCLDEVLGRTRTPLVAEESAVRSEETSLGDWVADRMVAALAACGAQAASVNSGSRRLNQDLAAGSAITRRHLEELFGFPAPLRLLRIDGATLQKVVDRAVQQYPGAGNWLQVSGFAFAHDSHGGTASALTLLAPERRLVDPGDQILVATTDYLIDRSGDQDGYTMLGPEQVVACPAAGKDLKEVVAETLRAAEPEGIAPETAGRICHTPFTGCQAILRERE